MRGGQAPTRIQITTCWPPYQLRDDSPLKTALLTAEQQAGLSPVAKIAGPSNIGNYLAGRGIRRRPGSVSYTRACGAPSAAFQSQACSASSACIRRGVACPACSASCQHDRRSPGADSSAAIGERRQP